MIPRLPILLPLALILLTLCNPVLAANTLNIEHAWIREAPPTSKVLAAYMTISNPGTRTVTIENITSPGFAAVEMHRTVIENGMARMRHMERLEVPANTTLRLEPGGLHLMLINPERAFIEGDGASLTLHLDNEICLTFTAPVKRATDAGSQHQHH